MGRLMMASGGARVLTLAVSAVATVLAARLIVAELGPEGYVEYGLLIAIPLLLPFLDLGTGAAVVNAMAGAGDDSSEVGRVLLGALRILISSAGVLVAAAAVVSVAGWWPVVFGADTGAGSRGYLVGLCVALFAVCAPLSLGQRVLVGAGKNHMAVLCQGLQAPLLLGLVALVLDRDSVLGSYPAVLFFASVLTVNVVFFVYGLRLRAGDVGFALRHLLDRSTRGARVMNEGWPALVLLVATPVAFHTDRLVLSHVGREVDLLHYTVASQVFLPVMSLSAVISLSLWPHYSAIRAGGQWPSPWKATGALGAAMVGVCLVTTVGTRLVYDFVAPGQVDMPYVVPAAFSLFVVAVTLNQSVAYSMMDAPGLRFQSGWATAMAVVSVGLSVALTPALGATGPLLASAAAVALFQFLPNAVRWHRQRSRHASDRANGAGPGEIEQMSGKGA